MAFFGLFKPNPEKLKPQLADSAMKMANEMERVYRGQIDLVSSESNSDVKLSSRGILKSRLYGTAFILFVFSTICKREESLAEFMNACSGVAMTPFADSNFDLSISNSEASSFAGDYMMKVFKAISDEKKQGSSSVSERTEGFTELEDAYKDSLFETLDQGQYGDLISERLNAAIKAVVFSNLRFMQTHIDEIS